MKPTVLTTYLTIIPLVAALHFGIYLQAFLLIFSAGFSLKYHGNFEKKWEIPDSLFATLVFFYNIYLLFLFRSKLEFSIPVILVTIAAFFFINREKYNYELNHSIWHILVITGTLLCSLGFGFL